MSVQIFVSIASAYNSKASALTLYIHNMPFSEVQTMHRRGQPSRLGKMVRVHSCGCDVVQANVTDNIPVQFPKRFPATLSRSASARLSGVSGGSGVQLVSRLASELCSSLDRDGLLMSAVAEGQHGASSVSGLNTSRAGPLSGEVSLKNGRPTTRDRLARRREAPVPVALSPKPPARLSAVVCFFKNFSKGFIPAGILIEYSNKACQNTN